VTLCAPDELALARYLQQKVGSSNLVLNITPTHPHFADFVRNPQRALAVRGPNAHAAGVPPGTLKLTPGVAAAAVAGSTAGIAGKQSGGKNTAGSGSKGAAQQQPFAANTQYSAKSQHVDGGALDGPVGGGGGASLPAHLEVGAPGNVGAGGFIISGGPSSPSGVIMDGAVPMHLAAHHHHHHADPIGPSYHPPQPFDGAEPMHYGVPPPPEHHPARFDEGMGPAFRGSDHFDAPGSWDGGIMGGVGGPRLEYDDLGGFERGGGAPHSGHGGPRYDAGPPVHHPHHDDHLHLARRYDDDLLPPPPPPHRHVRGAPIRGDTYRNEGGPQQRYDGGGSGGAPWRAADADDLLDDSWGGGRHGRHGGGDRLHHQHHQRGPPQRGDRYGDVGYPPEGLPMPRGGGAGKRIPAGRASYGDY
jgi:hypothetical protein